MTRRKDLRRQRETHNLSLRDIAKALGKEGSDIAKFAVKLNRYERNQGNLAPEELAAVTKAIASAHPPKNDGQGDEREALQAVNA